MKRDTFQKEEFLCLGSNKNTIRSWRLHHLHSIIQSVKTSSKFSYCQQNYCKLAIEVLRKIFKSESKPKPQSTMLGKNFEISKEKLLFILKLIPWFVVIAYAMRLNIAFQQARILEKTHSPFREISERLTNSSKIANEFMLEHFRFTEQLLDFINTRDCLPEFFRQLESIQDKSELDLGSDISHQRPSDYLSFLKKHTSLFVKHLDALELFSSDLRRLKHHNDSCQLNESA